MKGKSPVTKVIFLHTVVTTMSFSVGLSHMCPCVYRSVLAKAIHSLSRIGEELYVEPQKDGVSCCHHHQHFLQPSIASCWCTRGCVNEKALFFSPLTCSWPCGL